MTPLDLESLRAIELNLADELNRVCRAHGLTCFLAYGSLIGALRHGGFIPWDDDMDFVMLRDQHETLLANFDRWRSSEYFLLTSYHDGRTPFPFSEAVDVAFEGKVFTAPTRSDEFLTVQYGDWRTPPPEDARSAHVFKAFVRDGFSIEEVIAGSDVV